MMKCKSLLVLLTVVSATTCAVAAEVDLDYSVDFFDKYVWRGQELGHMGVLQPGATIGKNGFSANVWGNVPVTSNDPAGRGWNVNELDLTLDYSGTAGITNYSAGWILYTFPTPASATTIPTTQELYAAFDWDVFLSPAIAFYYDVKEVHGWYINLGSGYSFDLSEEVALDLGAALGWGDSSYNNAYWTAGTGSGFNDLALSAGLPTALGPVTVTPSLSYITLVDGSVRSNNGFSGKSEYWVLGIGVSQEF
ncbi:hypothetical protein ACFL3F_00660 [Planctomycetota bacterium]